MIYYICDKGRSGSIYIVHCPHPFDAYVECRECATYIYSFIERVVTFAVIEALKTHRFLRFL